MPLRPLVLLLLAVVAPVLASEATPTTQRVFVCTHSFMQFTCKMLPAIAKTAGITQVDAGMQMIGGSTCIQHWNLPDEKNKAKAALSAGNVDVLTLSPFYVMPDPGIDNYVKLGVSKNPALRVFVQASWPAFDSADGLPKQHVQAQRDGTTAAALKTMREAQNSGWRKQLEEQIAKLNQELGREAVRLIPVNDAVFTLRERIIEGKVPGLTKQTELFKDEIGHPTPPLALLVTYCHLAAIYGKSPVGLPVPGSLKENPQAEALTKVLQEVAWGAVKGYESRQNNEKQ
jgi:hypothetical protein